MTIEELNTLPKTWEEAKQLDSKFYFTGKACKHGHVCERYVSCRKCVICQDEFSKKWVQENPEKARINTAKWQRANPEKTKESKLKAVRKWGKNHPERKREMNKKWERENPEKHRAIRRRIRARRYAKDKNDPCFRLRSNFSRAIAHCLSSGKQGHSCFGLVDYTLDELKQHLESQFTEGMTWEKYGTGGWVVDHVKPQCSYYFASYNTPEFKACWALSNLRPLWEEDNLKKVKEDKKLSWKIKSSKIELELVE